MLIFDDKNKIENYKNYVNVHVFPYLFERL